MQAPATVLQSLLANIRSRQQFIRAQAQAGNPNLERVQASQVSSLRGLIASQPFLEVDDATTLTEEVSSGIWSPEERISLITAISDASARRVAPMTRAARKQQSCYNVHLFSLPAIGVTSITKTGPSRRNFTRWVSVCGSLV